MAGESEGGPGGKPQTADTARVTQPPPPMPHATGRPALAVRFDRQRPSASRPARGAACAAEPKREMMGPSALQWTLPGESCENIMIPDVWAR